MAIVEFVWVHPNGETEPLGFPAEIYGTFRLSPDGRHLAVVVYEAQQETWIFDLDRGTRRRLAESGGSPIWSRDGSEVYFFSSKEGTGEVFHTRADGSTQPSRVDMAGVITPFPACLSPDGGTLLLVSFSQTMDIYQLNLQTGEARPFLATAANEAMPEISPDGNWIAYFSDASGSNEVYIQKFPEGGRTLTVSSGGGEEPYWSPKGDRLFYRNNDRWMAVDIFTTPEFSAGRPQLVIQGAYSNPVGISYNVHPDGERFLLLRTPEDNDQPLVPQIIVNWDEELNRLVPTE
jgi:Tol biopolymer transport system component